MKKNGRHSLFQHGLFGRERKGLTHTLGRTVEGTRGHQKQDGSGQGILRCVCRKLFLMLSYYCIDILIYPFPFLSECMRYLGHFTSSYGVSYCCSLIGQVYPCRLLSHAYSMLKLDDGGRDICFPPLSSDLGKLGTETCILPLVYLAPAKPTELGQGSMTSVAEQVAEQTILQKKKRKKKNQA